MKKLRLLAVLTFGGTALTAFASTELPAFPRALTWRQSTPAPVAYVLKAGDTVSSVAVAAKLAPETVLSFNQIASPRYLRAGQKLFLPPWDGVTIQLKEPRSVEAVAKDYQVFASYLLFANGLPPETKRLTGRVFLPGVAVRPEDLPGRMFAWPTVGGRITSYFGRRNDPFTGLASSHSGVDIANRWGSPVLAAGAGTVTATGFSSILGNYIQINQGEGYTVVYGHLSAVQVRVGQKVRAGRQIGRVGSTGYSTGPHLHFSAYYHNRLMNPMKLFG